MTKNPIWQEMVVNLTANEVKQVNLPGGVNTVIIRNPDLVNNIRLGVSQGTSSTDYESTAQPDGAGLIVRPYDFIDSIFLVATANISKVRITAAWTENPIQLLPAAGIAPVNQVNVATTAGLKASELKISAAKNLGVGVNENPLGLLEVTDLNFDSNGDLCVVVNSPIQIEQVDRKGDPIPTTIYGKSTDTKPTTGNMAGDGFLEMDTKDLYLWDGDTWILF